MGLGMRLSCYLLLILNFTVHYTIFYRRVLLLLELFLMYSIQLLFVFLQGFTLLGIVHYVQYVTVLFVSLKGFTLLVLLACSDSLSDVTTKDILFFPSRK